MGNLEDPLIIANILKFSHVSDWNKMKPYLICTVFGEVFTNHKFAKDYLINLFTLSEGQQELLEEVIEHFSVEEDWMEDQSERRKKKRKKTVNTFQRFPHLDQVYSQILRLYGKCCWKSHTKEPRRLLKSEKKLQSNFERLMGHWSVECDGFDFSTCLSELLSNHKGIYMLKHKTTDTDFYSHKSIRKQDSEFVLFTHCGFPLIFRIIYSTRSQFEYSSMEVGERAYLANICNMLGAQVASTEVDTTFHTRELTHTSYMWDEEFFSHSLDYQYHHGSYTSASSYSKRVFKGVVLALFDPYQVESSFQYQTDDADKLVTISKKNRKKLLGSIIYDVLGCCLVEKSKNNESLYRQKIALHEHNGLPMIV